MNYLDDIWQDARLAQLYVYALSGKVLRLKAVMNALNWTDKDFTKQAITTIKDVRKGAKNAIIVPAFVDDDYVSVFAMWLEYKRDEFKETYKSENSLKQLYHKLLSLSGGDPDTATKVVEQSIASHWRGLFELKENYARPKQQYYNNREQGRERMRQLATSVVSATPDLFNLYNGAEQHPNARQN